ncbi:DoxX family membrane protein [Gordonia sp. CPCC 205333]|uniref:DoxX family membrane protein n=1 Tax=Gordonia sp. CPCC 205333 TaxID=3140790 RepID=UPI003AF36920
MIRRIARPLLGSIFIYNGYRTLRNSGTTAQAAEPLVDKATTLLPDSPAVPQDPQTWVLANAGVQLGGGLLLATGKLPRVASLTLAGSLVPTTYVDYPFWEEADPAVRQEKQTHFIQNVALLGGLLIAGFDTEGKPGVVWRGKRAAERVSDRVSGAVTSITPSGSSTPEISDRAHEWASNAEDFAAHAADRFSAARKVAGAKLEEAAAKAAPVVSDAASTAAARASTLAKVAGERFDDVASEVAERAPEVASAAADTARKTAPIVAERAYAASDAVRNRAVPVVAERARTWRERVGNR